MSLIIKELYFLKAQWKKILLTFAIILGIITYQFYKNSSSIMNILLSIFISGTVFALQILQNSIQYEKTNKTFEKMLTVYSVREILFYKCITCCIICDILGCIIGISSYTFQNIVSKSINLKIFIGALLLMIFFNFLVSLLVSIILIFINQIIIVNVVVMFLIMIIMSIAFELIEREDIFIYTLSICSVSTIITMVIFVFLKFIPKEILTTNK
jgi:hypothetical protein